MPKGLKKLRQMTEEEEQEYDEKVLIPKMYSDIVTQLKKDNIRSKELTKETEILKD